MMGMVVGSDGHAVSLASDMFDLYDTDADRLYFPSFSQRIYLFYVSIYIICLTFFHGFILSIYVR